MNRINRRPMTWIWRWIVVGCGASLGACAPMGAPTRPPTVIAQAVATISPGAPTAVALPTDTPTDEPSPTPSVTATRTVTPSPTSTATSTPTATARPTLGPTATFTPPPAPTVSAPLFPQTITHPWSREDFLHESNEVPRYVNGFLMYFRDTVVAKGNTGECRVLFNYYNELTVSQAAYNDVPAEWYALYFEYRTIIHETIAAIQPLVDVCAGGGGDVPPEVDQQIISAVTDLLARAIDLDGRVQAHP